MRNAQGVVKVMDFGIARALWSPELTQADHPLGTPEYMSPEQVQAEEIDARADIYSLGVLLFKMLTGRLPFTGDSPYDIMRAPPRSSIQGMLPPDFPAQMTDIKQGNPRWEDF